jgi:hypothetical protein
MTVVIAAAIDTWLYETITAAVVGTAAQGRVHALYIPDATYPAVTFAAVDAGSPVRQAGSGTAIVWENITVVVKAHSIGGGHLALAPIVAAFTAALEQRGETDDLWVRVCRRTGEAIKQYQVDEGVHYNALGYQFGISAQEK